MNTLLIQICFHFDAYCRREITGDISKMLLRYLFHQFPSYLQLQKTIQGHPRIVLVCCFYCLSHLYAIMVFYHFIFLLTSMIPSNCHSWNTGFLKAEIFFHKYSPYIRNSMLKIVYISNINQLHFMIFHLVNVRKIQHHFLCRFKVQPPVMRP